MSPSWMRTAAMSCLIAGGAMIAGPGLTGAAVASADLLGIDILDILGGDDDEKKSEHPASRVNAQQNESRREDRGFGIPNVGLPPVGADLAESPGGGAAPSSGGAGRASTLPPVPSEPSARGVVIRAEPTPPAVAAAPAPVPVIAPPLPVAPMPPVPVGAPLAPGPSPVAPPRVVIPQPGANQPPRSGAVTAPANGLNSHAIPDSFRAGYPDYLRSADISDLLIATLPGVTGMVAFTAAGGLVGFRQARAVQVLPPVGIARFLQ